MINSLQFAVPATIISARTGTGASDTFALPARACYLAWQTSFDVAPSAIDIDIDVSLDNSVWTTLDTSVDINGEVWTIADPVAALFVRAYVNTNTGNRAVTAVMVAKAIGG